MRVLALILACFGQWVFAQKPKISFFNEQEGPELEVLFKDSTLLPNLKSLGAEIRMGMLDLSSQRAQVLRSLNNAEIPVVAWLLLPKEKGYWFHSGNADEAFTRYFEIRDWAQEEGIVFSGIGIDLELDMNDIALFQNQKLMLLSKIIGRLYGQTEFEQSREAYKRLIAQVRSDGYPIESYYVPFIRKESEEGRTALQQATGFMDLETDKDIPMLYTSFMGNPYGTLKVLALDENLKAVALGSTGGGFDPTMPSMSWEDLAYDLRLASQTANEIHIFCLEAAVEKGFLPRLLNFDFNEAVMPYPEQISPVLRLQDNVLRISAILSYPTALLGTVFLIFLGLIIGLVLPIRYVFRRIVSGTKT
jgi:hypothetical protein